MTTIAIENKKSIRKGMAYQVAIDETPDKPLSVYAANVFSEYEDNAKATQMGSVVRIMDLCTHEDGSEGFLNDGNSLPAQVEVMPGLQKYGYISSDVADENGVFVIAPAITINASSEWDYITLTLCDSELHYSQQVFQPEWEDGSCTIVIDTFVPYERCHIVKVSLGKAWQFDNDDLLKINMNLRGLSNAIEDGFELEMSEVEITAYTPDGDRWKDIFARMKKLSPISITMGYTEDMTEPRVFYVSDQVDFNDTEKTLTVRGTDATAFLDDEFKETPTHHYSAGTSADVEQRLFAMIRDYILSPLAANDVGLKVTGEVPAGSGSTVSNLFFKNDSRRKIIANACALYRDPESLCITYRDGGLPELIAGMSEQTWNVMEEDVADFSTSIEMNVNEIQSTLYTYNIGGTEEVASQSDAEAGQTYILDTSEPVYQVTGIDTSVEESGRGTATIITPYSIKVVCTAAGTLSVLGKFVKESTKYGEDPAVVSDPEQRGISVEIDALPKIPTEVTEDKPSGSLTIDAIGEVLKKSNLLYSFVHRGNPHWKNLDHITFTRLDGTVLSLTILTMEYSIENGGMTCAVTCREGWF